MDHQMLRNMIFGSQQASQLQSGENDPNVLFYRNEIPSKPDGDLCENIHAKWDGDWERMEFHHGYIQWLFPVFENAGMNFESQALSKSGAALIRSDPAAARRVLNSYKLILKFYGLVLADEKTGAVVRHEDAGFFAERMENLNMSAHNWLRVSRIITSLGELGFKRYKAPLIERLTAEAEAGTLGNAQQSLERFWKPLVTGEGEDWYNAKTREEDADREESCIFATGGELHG